MKRLFQISPLLPREIRLGIIVSLDALAAAGSFVLSLVLAHGGNLPLESMDRLPWLTGIFTISVCATFAASGLYRGFWRYASMTDLLKIVTAVTLAVLIFLGILFLWSRGADLPRSALVVNWFVLIVLAGGMRFVYRMARDVSLSPPRVSSGGIPILLAGPDDDTEAFIRSLRRSAEAPWWPAGILSRTGSGTGLRIHGVPVLGEPGDLEAVMGTLHGPHRPQKLVLAGGGWGSLDELLSRAVALDLVLMRAPLSTALRDETGTPDIHPVAVEDLLDRPQHRLDRAGMTALLSGRRILVTGAGGSIGGEIVRQIAPLNPASVTLLDNCEYNLYQIDRALESLAPEIARTAHLADVNDREGVFRLFRELKPEVVFHAAALKHVPMVENNPEAGIRTNVLGTRTVADACVENQTSVMVLISTDKAVNPENIMGLAKSVAEQYAQALDNAGMGAGTGAGTGAGMGAETGCRFVTVRFGNVLGSTGSVVPLFQAQLEAGGPLTVTDPRMERFFMTAQEAAALVLQASVAASRSEEYRGRIMALDMGRPVRIEHLARQMIRLAGLRPDEDIAITFTGLRPGEKITESLFHDFEDSKPTDVDGVLSGVGVCADLPALRAALEKLAEHILSHRIEDATALLREIGRRD